MVRRTCKLIGKSDPKLQNFFKNFECGKQAICLQIIKYSVFNKTFEGKVINSALWTYHYIEQITKKAGKECRNLEHLIAENVPVTMALLSQITWLKVRGWTVLHYSTYFWAFLVKKEENGLTDTYITFHFQKSWKISAFPKAKAIARFLYPETSKRGLFARENVRVSDQIKTQDIPTSDLVTKTTPS